MASPSFAQYALCYDLLYQNKPYAAEVDYLETLFRRHGKGPVESVYDIAAGTGAHLTLLAKRGYSCAGSDLSENMIGVAKKKAAEAGLAIDYRVAPMQQGAKVGQFDAVICMFSAIDYLADRESLVATFENVRQNLKPGGLFVFDFWNGIEASRNFSPVTVKECHAGRDWLLRVGRSTHDVARQTILVQFEMFLFNESALVSRFTEDHPMRYWYPREMEENLAYAGFRVLSTCPFLEPEKALRPNDWNVGVVATPMG